MMFSDLLIAVMCSLLVVASAVVQRKVVKMEENCMASCPEQRYQKYCTVEVQAYSGYNSSCDTANEGFVKLNGETFWNAGWCSERGNSRGVTIIKVDTFSCTASAIRQFDTHESESNAAALATYLQQLPLGAVVIGVTGDEPAAKLRPALETLKSMTVDVEDLQYGGNFAFVLQTGHNFQPVVEKRLDAGDEPAKIAVQLEDVCGTLVQQNIGGSTYFNRTWEEYKVGFGNITSNFWIGNDKLHNLTVDGDYKLRVELLAKYNNQWYWAEYETFTVQDELGFYLLLVNGYSGTAGDSLGNSHAVRFTTPDRDNDFHCSFNCGSYYGSGFWYNACGYASINSHIELASGFAWYNLPIGSPTNWADKKLVISRMFLLLK